MTYAILSTCVIAVILVWALVFIKIKKSGSNEPTIFTDTNDFPIERSIMRVEETSLDRIQDKSSLVEITNSNVLSLVSKVIPTVVRKSSEIGNSTLPTGEKLYRVVIPKGAELANSSVTPNAQRAFFHNKQKKGISGHAELLEVEQPNLAKTKAVSSVMNIASMAVGQYYMSQINKDISKINSNISKISNFQDNEFKSKVLAITAQLETTVPFQEKILENKELRENKLLQINGLEQECIELLGQANLTVSGFAEKSNIDYEQYTKELLEAQNWYLYQTVLFDTLSKLSELKYALHLGKLPKEQCSALLPIYAKQIEKSQTSLKSWHNTVIEKLGVDMVAARRKRDGLDGILHWIPGLFNNDLNFRPISDDTLKMIEMQTSDSSFLKQTRKIDLFSKDVHLLAENGRIYYIPPNLDNEEGTVS